MTDELIKRLEEAGEGSRELDADIWEVVVNNCYSPYYRHQYAPHYSTSLDAALTLVPANLNVSHMAWDKAAAAVVLGPERAPDLEPVGAATPALALCAASLKARQHEG